MDFDAEIVDLMKRNAVRVPTCPTAALKLRSVLERAEHEVNEVVDAVKTDPALAAAVLRVANSVYFRRGQAATTLKAAVQRVGEKELERLALAAGLARELLRSGPLAEVRRAIWHDAMASAVACEALARTGHDIAPDEAFLVGLLHDVGKLVAVGAIEQVIAQHRNLPTRSATEWAEVVERYHVELGLVLAARWSLPDVVSEAISQHHAAIPIGPCSALVSLVVAGDQVAALLSAGSPADARTLAAVPWLKTQQARELAAASLVDAAAIIAGFEPEPDRGTYTSIVSQVPIEPVTPSEAFMVRLVAKDLQCRGVVLARERVQFLSTRALTTNFLVEVELSRDGEAVRAWTKVTACQPSHGAYLVEAVPFALSADVNERWRHLAAPTPMIRASRVA